MSDTNLETLEYLKQQQKEIEQKIQKHIASERKKRLTDIIANMQEYNITLDDIQAAFENKQKSSIVRYINPETGATWSGIGKRPKWIIQAMNCLLYTS
ncbi:H-NS histone family protein, partial [Kingella kingae]|uniref:H-NS histone family protein n=1 Tax=Kingella kingae TaxID=504 RepID=UPI002551685D